MNKIWFKKVKDTSTFKKLPDGFKPFVKGGYGGFFIPASKEGWVVLLFFFLATIVAVASVIINDFSRVTNFFLIALPLVICIIVAKIKS